MPKQSDDMGRIEVYGPAAVLDAIRRAAAGAGESAAAYILRAAAKRAGVEYRPPTPGRRKKPAPDPA